MITVVSFLDRLAPGLYILLTAAFAWNLWKARRTGHQYRATYFELEREMTRVRRVNALTVLVLVGLAGLLLLGVQKSMLPFLRQVQDIQAFQQEIAQNIDGSFATSTPRSPDQAALNIQPVAPLGGDDNPIIQLTPTLTPEPLGTIIPNPPDTQGCTDPRATLNLPANGMRIFQPIALEGTAYTDNFSEAKIEISGPATNDAWSVIAIIPQPVMAAGAFYQFSPAPYADTGSGLYQLRLMVFDITQQPVASCMINIYISAPPETPTPTVTPSS